MSPAIEYNKQITSVVYINPPDFKDPSPGMSGSELLHGFLAEINQAMDPEVKYYIDSVCRRWNVYYRSGLK
jgi:hypothetical protein